MKSKKSIAKMYFYFLFFTVSFLVMPPLLQAGTIVANAGCHPSTVSKGQPTEIIVEVLSNQGPPIAGAHVKISAGGGVFLYSNNTVVEGHTDANGMFATHWKCDQCAPAYVFAVEVNKPGFQGWNGETKVEISSQPGPVQGSQIFANAGTHPPVVSPGQPTMIRVEAFSDKGMSVPQAHVRISAGGGVFTDSNNTTIEGHTGADGAFETPWKCIPCAPAYVLNIEVNKPGLQGWTGEAKVEVSNQPPPLPGGPIVVNAGTHPPVVSRGQPTEIKVEALSNQGTPIPGAFVKISAGGGVFLNANDTVIVEQTDNNGIFVTPWKCDPCASAYVFDIEVNKPGFEKGKANVQVNITSQPSGQPPTPPTPPQPPKPLPDIAVSSVKIYPSQPGPGKKFTAVVYITNKGKAVSGKFDLAIHMKNVTSGHIYPVGTFRRDAMKPGEQIPWQKQDLMVNNPGSYQFRIDIKPFLFKDQDNSNNTYGWTFQVN